jgi:VWFA-related protein
MSINCAWEGPRRVHAWTAITVSLALQAGIHGQQAPPFRAETRLVVLHATVRNSRGEAVTGLERSAFTVYENGKRQPITLFRHDDVPVSIGLLIDNSGSMRSLRSKVESASLAFARASNPLDELFVLNFADTPHLDVPFTSDLHVMETGIARVDSIGGTAMRDAIGVAETYMSEHSARDRRVLLVITDGNDNSSVVARDRILKDAQQQGTVIYAVGLFGTDDASRIKRGREELDELTERTGGIAHFPADIGEIDTTVLDIARQIRNDYTIAYAPVNQALDGSYRNIRLVAAGRERLTVRSRAGYRASPVPSTGRHGT